jgi:hypothetical protein
MTHPVLTGLLQWLGLIAASWILFIPLAIAAVWILFVRAMRGDE